MALANLVFGNLQQSKRVLGLIKSNKSFLPFQSSYHRKKRARTIPHIKTSIESTRISYNRRTLRKTSTKKYHKMLTVRYMTKKQHFFNLNGGETYILHQKLIHHFQASWLPESDGLMDCMFYIYFLHITYYMI